MINRKWLKTTFLKEFDYYLNSKGKIDFNKTPLLHKISVGLDEDDTKKYIKNFHEWVLENNDFGYNMLDKMFDFRTIEQFKIAFNQKEYRQIDYKTPLGWFNTFLQDNNFTIKELLLYNKTQNTTVFSTQFFKNTSELIIEDKTLYFQHRNFGLDRMNKDINNPETEKSGWGKLKEKLEMLNSNITLAPDGSILKKKLKSIEYEQYNPNYDSNSSNL